jgi:hypothetical protein
MANGLPSFVTAQPFSSTPVVGDNFGDSDGGGGGGDETATKKPLTPKQDTAEAKIEKMEAQRELSKVEKAQSEGKAAAEKARQAAIYEEYKPELTKKFETFQPTKDTFQGLASIGMMMMAVGSMGGKKGLTSATGAMNAIAGMATGYQQGRKEEFDRQKAIFDENYRIMKENQAQIEKEFQYALKYAKTDLTGAANYLKQQAHARGDKTFAAEVDNSGPVVATNKQVSASRSAISKIEEARNKVFEAEKKVIRAEAAEGSQASVSERREKDLADFIVRRNEVPKSTEEKAAVQKYYPTYDVKGSNLGPAALIEAVVPGGSRNFKSKEDLTNVRGYVEGIDVSDRIQRLARDPDIVFGNVQSYIEQLRDKVAANIPKGQEDNAATVEAAINATPVDPRDKNQVFAKEALFWSFDIERAARGGNLLPVGFIKTAGPQLDPKQYSREGFLALVQGRKDQLYSKLKTYGFTDNQSKDMVNLIAKPETVPGSFRQLQTTTTPAGGGLPPEAVNKLKEGQITTFGNGQKWTLENGQPVQIQQ